MDLILQIIIFVLVVGISCYITLRLLRLSKDSTFAFLVGAIVAVLIVASRGIVG